LWDVAADNYRATGSGHHTGFVAFALSPDGRWLAVQPKGEALTLWDTTTRKLIANDVKDVPWNGGFAFSPDGRMLASWGQNVVHFWEMPSGKQLRQLWRKGPPGPIAWSPDAKVLALATAGNSKVSLVDLDSGEVLRSLEEGDNLDPAARWVRALVFSPDGQTLAVVHSTHIVVWNWRSGDKLHTLQPGDLIASAFFSPDGRTLTAAAEISGMVPWQVASGKQQPPRWQGAFSVYTAAASPDGRLVLMAGPLDTVQLWELATRDKRWEVPTHHGRLGPVAFAARGGLMVTTHEDGTILLWQLRKIGKPAPDMPAKLTEKQQDQLWADLASPSGPVAHQAIVELVARPAQALSLLKQRLPSIYGDRIPDLAKWLADLDSNQFKVRAKASKDIEKAGKLAEPALWKLLAAKPALEVVRRVEALLAKLEAAQGPAPDGAWLQALRAIETVERLGTPEAHDLLEALARTTPETWISWEARQALAR
jgi:hypothetical protein